jgi:hypothetical protein
MASGSEVDALQEATINSDIDAADVSGCWTCEKGDGLSDINGPVSYTHLTLPTKLL